MLINSLDVVSFPSSFNSLLPLSRTPHPVHLNPVMLIVVWVCRLEIDLRELVVGVLTYVFGVFVWYVDRLYERRANSAACTNLCIAPPS